MGPAALGEILGAKVSVGTAEGTSLGSIVGSVEGASVGGIGTGGVNLLNVFCPETDR